MYQMLHLSVWCYSLSKQVIEEVKTVVAMVIPYTVACTYKPCDCMCSTQKDHYS